MLIVSIIYGLPRYAERVLNQSTSARHSKKSVLTQRSPLACGTLANRCTGYFFLYGVRSPLFSKVDISVHSLV